MSGQDDVNFEAGRRYHGTTFPDEHIADKAREITSVDAFAFPLDLGKHSFVMNFVKFKMGFIGAPIDDIVCSIALPLPGTGIVDKSGMKYNQDELGVIGGAIGGVTQEILDEFKKGGALSTANGNVPDAGGDELQLLKTLTQATSAAGRQAINELGQGLGATADQAFGNVINPHVVLLFKQVDLKTFTLQWKLAPQSRDESKQLKFIIQKIQEMAHPEQKTEANGANFFLNYPNQVDLFYAGVQENLHYFKRCAITGIEVNYQPEGDNLLFAKTAAPTRVDLQLEFQETEIWTAEDYQQLQRRKVG